jgi:tetratricopeptide (TPR) repeat protein
MKTYRLLASLLIGCALALVAASPVAAKDKWINVRTKRFNIVSNADSDDARNLALKLEQFRTVFSKLFKVEEMSPVPITVLAFKSDGSFIPFKPLYNGKPANVGGYFQRGEDENIIALNLSTTDEYPLRVILHEYTHLLTAYNLRAWPLWLNEGIAELYSTFDIRKNEVTMGKPISNHVYLLRQNKFAPFQTLFNVGHDSANYNERDKQGIFYAESWALVHYLMYGDKGTHHPQLVEFVKQFESGKSVEAAFAAAFKTEFAAMEKELRRYIGNDTYPGMTYTLDSTEGDKEVTERPLTEAEAQYYLGDLLSHINRIDDAEKFFKQALALDQTLPGPYEGLGLVAMRRQQFAEAREYLKQAATRGSRNHLAHFYYAETLQHELRANGDRRSATSQEAASRIVEELKTSINLMPGFAPAYNLLAFTYLSSGENFKEALQTIQIALRLEPQNEHAALTLAQIQMRMEDFVAAKKTLEPLLASNEPSIRSVAESTKSYIDSYSRQERRTTVTREASPSQAPVGEEATTEERGAPPRLKRGREDAATTGDKAGANGRDSSRANANDGTEKEDSFGNPTLKIDGAQIISGTLVGIECGNGGMVLVFRSADKLLRFDVRDLIALQFYTQDPNISPQVGCGPMNVAAFIHYKPLPDKSAKFAGDAVAVEFKKRH